MIPVRRSSRTSTSVVITSPPTSSSKRTIASSSSINLPTSKKSKSITKNVNFSSTDEVITPSTSISAEEGASILREEAEDSAKKAEEEKVLLHPEITINFGEGRTHLISIDTRWKSLIDSLECTVFQGKNTAFNPFRSLVTSIIGQQISYLAARAVTYRFTRLFYPHLPEKMVISSTAAPTTAAPSTLETSSPFPTPAQVVALDDPTTALRSAGLSGRKAEYVIELAQQFHDGRLDAAKLWEMSDEEIMTTLTAVRGIGPWSVHMFLIFSMRRADIMPWGDLGVQKNICKWYSSDPNSIPVVAPDKLATNARIPSTPIKSKMKKVLAYPTPSSPSTKEAKGAEDTDGNELESPIPAIILASAVSTPSTTSNGNHFVFPQTTNNLTSDILRARLNGKKLKGNIYLTPIEMNELSEQWRPYRSIACWYLWSLSDGSGDP